MTYSLHVSAAVQCPWWALKVERKNAYGAIHGHDFCQLEHRYFCTAYEKRIEHGHHRSGAVTPHCTDHRCAPARSPSQFPPSPTEGAHATHRNHGRERTR